MNSRRQKNKSKKRSLRQLAGRRNKRTDYLNPAYLFVACDFSFGLSFERDQFFSALKPLLSVKARLLNKQFASKCPPILSAFFCVECTPFIILFFEDVFSVPSFREQFVLFCGHYLLVLFCGHYLLQKQVLL